MFSTGNHGVGVDRLKKLNKEIHQIFDIELGLVGTEEDYYELVYGESESPNL